MSHELRRYTVRWRTLGNGWKEVALTVDTYTGEDAITQTRIEARRISLNEPICLGCTPGPSQVERTKCE